MRISSSGAPDADPALRLVGGFVISMARDTLELAAPAPHGRSEAVGPHAGVERQRHFLFVTAPFGPFARELGGELRVAGARCSRVLLNGGDMIDWGLGHALAYTGDRRAFAGWLAEMLRDRQVTDLIVHGDSGFYARTALDVAAAAGVRRHVFEQGYFRPDWITLERDGVNRHSHLPRQARDYLEAARELPEPEAASLGKVTPSAVWRIVAHHLAYFPFSPLFSRFEAPYEVSPVVQAAGHALRYLRQRWRRLLAGGRPARPLAGEQGFFLVLLQRPGDSQLDGHQGAEGLAPIIDRITASFAAHAPAGVRLVFKAHPLDPGLENHAASAARSARRHGAEGRVVHLDEGRLDDLLPRCAGVVTVNSSGALAALGAGKPTLALGEAIYDLPGLTDQGGLDGFWRAPSPPDAELFAAFRKVVIARTQINGAFAKRAGRRLAIPEAARRLLASR